MLTLTQLPMFAPAAAWVPPTLASLPSWREAKRVAIDCETCDPHLKELGPGVRRGGRIVGVSFAVEDGPAVYLPFGHAGGDNLPAEHVLEYLRDQADCFAGDLVGANLSYDLDYLEQAGVRFRPRFCRDVQVAEPLLDELQDGYSLQAIAERHGLPGKAEDQLRAAAEAYGVDAKAGLWRLPARHVGAYAEQDARLPLQLLRRQERLLEEQNLWGVYDLESRLLPVLVKLRRRGVRVDFDRLEQVETWSLQEEEKALAEVHRLTGARVAVGEVWKAEALARVLSRLGVQVPLTPQTKKPSVTRALLASVDHDAARMLLRARKVNKVRTTFAASVRMHAVGDRVHPTFNQLRSTKDRESEDSGARYGRLSSSDPNLQQQPARDPELGPMWRSVYVPDEGYPWACLDYSQQEPRWLVDYAERSRCTGAAATAQRYRSSPKTDSHQMMAEIAHIQRKQAKEIFLGLCYGMGPGKLCRKLNLPTTWAHSARLNKMVEVAGPEGAALLRVFDAAVPFVRELADRCEAQAKRRGYILTVLGRRCRFPRAADGQFDWCHKALNRLIQGSSGDQTKKAMVDADAAGIYQQLQVHDEIDASLGPEDAQRLAAVMREAVPCRVPMVVDVELGRSWGEVG